LEGELLRLFEAQLVGSWNRRRKLACDIVVGYRSRTCLLTQARNRS